MPWVIQNDKGLGKIPRNTLASSSGTADEIRQKEVQLRGKTWGYLNTFFHWPNQQIEINCIWETGAGATIKLSLGDFRCPDPDKCFGSSHM